MARLSLLAALTALLPLAAAQATPTFTTQLQTGRTRILKAAGAASGSFTTLSRQERDVLVELLRDKDPNVRIAALRSLRNYVTQTSRTRDAVLSVFRNENEKEAVRKQAAKTLSFVTHNNGVRDVLLDYGRYGTLDGLRAISLKALYTQGHSSRVRDYLVHLARYESSSEVRRGAIWALFNASGDNRVRDALVGIAGSDAALDIRVEAMKSLYNGMGHSRLRDTIERTARYGSEKEIRYAAILLLSRIQSSRTRDLLQTIAQRESDAELRQAAILAMNPTDNRIREYFHLLRRDANGGVIDPLDGE